MGTTVAELKFMAQVPHELRRIANNLDGILNLLKEVADLSNGKNEKEEMKDGGF